MTCWSGLTHTAVRISSRLDIFPGVGATERKKRNMSGADLAIGYPNTTREVPRRRRRRLVLVAGAGVVVALGLTGAVVGRLPFVPGPGDSQGGMCARTLSAHADLSQLPAGERFDPHDPAAACARHWDAMWGGHGTPRPQRFAACYHPTSDGRKDGGAVVFPADGYPDPAAACAAIGFLPIEPVTK
jgi:hypothetical protein